MNKIYKITLLEKDKVQKKWQHFNIPHGIYLLEFDIDSISSWDGSHCLLDGVVGRLELCREMKTIFQSVSVGQTRFNGICCSMVGRFRKSGNTIFFDPLTEETF
ncbi:hypothetical protein CPT_Melville_236 [Salmonella phage Melville]|uniref:Uncharacterized protein n=1 Tax=Salmonella phage Melville TaxID=2041413 RepID=A0A2D1GMD5_9CAUD|nr:hypothetical protein FDI73_gp165 [Salmonella phage Melville]ATN93199.1 hypothetical protein CPT_Melville_236 [Salmonella phage Melville]UPW42342.1 hypothetical protein EBPHNEJP_00044 [Salmonella phage CF-SP2]